MDIKIRIFIAIGGILLGCWVFANLRKRLLNVTLGIIFLSISITFLACAWIPYTFDALAYILHIEYPPILYLVIVIFFLFFLVIQLAIHISQLNTRCRILCRELSYLKTQIKAYLEDVRKSEVEKNKPQNKAEQKSINN